MHNSLLKRICDLYVNNTSNTEYVRQICNVKVMHFPNICVCIMQKTRTTAQETHYIYIRIDSSLQLWLTGIITNINCQLHRQQAFWLMFPMTHECALRVISMLVLYMFYTFSVLSTCSFSGFPVGPGDYFISYLYYVCYMLCCLFCISSCLCS